MDNMTYELNYDSHLKLSSIFTQCLKLALSNNWSLAITPYRNGTFVADFSCAKTDEVIVYVTGTTTVEALDYLLRAVRENKSDD